MLGFLSTMNDFLSTQQQVMQAYLLEGRGTEYRRIAAKSPTRPLDRNDPGMGAGTKDREPPGTGRQLTIPWPRITRWAAGASRLWTRRGKGCRSCRSA